MVFDCYCRFVVCIKWTEQTYICNRQRQTINERLRQGVQERGGLQDTEDSSNVIRADGSRIIKMLFHAIFHRCGILAAHAFVHLVYCIYDNGVTATATYLSIVISSIGRTQRQTTINYAICLLYLWKHVCEWWPLLSSLSLEYWTQMCLDFVCDAIQSKHEIPQASEKKRERENTVQVYMRHAVRKGNKLLLSAGRTYLFVLFCCLNFTGIYSVYKKDDNFSFRIYSHLSFGRPFLPPSFLRRPRMYILHTSFFSFFFLVRSVHDVRRTVPWAVYCIFNVSIWKSFENTQNIFIICPFDWVCVHMCDRISCFHLIDLFIFHFFVDVVAFVYDDLVALFILFIVPLNFRTFWETLSIIVISKTVFSCLIFFQNDQFDG